MCVLTDGLLNHISYNFQLMLQFSLLFFQISCVKAPSLDKLKVPENFILFRDPARGTSGFLVSAGKCFKEDFLDETISSLSTNTSRTLMWRRNIHTHRSCSGNNLATKNQIASTIWIADVIAIPRTTFYKQNCLRKAPRDRVGIRKVIL